MKPKIRHFKRYFICFAILVGIMLLHGCGASMSKLTKAAHHGDLVATEAALKDGAKVDELDGFGQSALYNAVESKNIEIARSLLTHGANPNLCTVLGQCPIVTAARHGDVALVRLLVEAGADVNQAENDGDRAMHVAILSGKPSGSSAPTATSRVQHMIAMLKQHGTNSAQYKAALRALSAPTVNPAKTDNDIVVYLLEQRADVNVANRAGEYPIMLAVNLGNKDVVNLLLEAGAKVSHPELERMGKPSLVTAAASKGAWELVDRFLREGGQVSDALEGAILSGNIEKTEHYLSRGASPSLKMMRVAVSTKNKAMVNMLLENGYSSPATTIKVLDKGYKSSLVTEAIVTDDPELVKMVLLTGADSNEGGLSNSLCKARSLEVLNLLIAAGADVNMPCQDYQGRQTTPLHYASITESGYEETKALLVAGANPNAREHDESTPLHGYADRPRIMSLLIAMGGNVNARESDGDTPLHQVAYKNHDETAQVLIAAGANVNAMDSDGFTPLDNTVAWGGEIDSPATYSLIKSHGGRLNKKKKEKGGSSFSRVFATLAIAGLAGSADISDADRASVMSATVNDVWVKDGKGTQLGSMYMDAVGGTQSSGNPFLDDLRSTKAGQLQASEILRKQMAEYQQIIEQKRQLQQQKPTVYQQELLRIAAQTGSGSVAVAQPAHSGSAQGAAARHQVAPAYAAQAGVTGAPAATSHRPSVSADSLAASSPAVAARSVTTGDSRKEQVPCEGRTESGNPLPSGECGIIYADYSRTLHFEYDDYRDVFMSEGGSRASAENSLRVAMRKRADEMCKQEGYTYLYHPSNYRLREIEATVKECKDYKRAGTTFYLCRGSSEFTCARREEK